MTVATEEIANIQKLQFQEEQKKKLCNPDLPIEEKNLQLFVLRSDFNAREKNLQHSKEMNQLLKTRTLQQLTVHLRLIRRQLKLRCVIHPGMVRLSLSTFGFCGNDIFDGIHVFGCTPLGKTDPEEQTTDRFKMLFDKLDEKDKASLEKLMKAIKWYLPTSYDKGLAMIDTMIEFINYIAQSDGSVLIATYALAKEIMIENREAMIF